jgi:hypothetical protein
MTDTNRPLWEVMDDSYGTHLTQEESYGAMIRAIVREIHARPHFSRGELLVWLRDEADRAEAGE